MLIGAPNFRDLGGLVIDQHRRVRTGLVYRSSQLSRLTEADIAAVRALGIITTVDLRSVRERHAQPTPDALRGVGDYQSPKADTDFIFQEIFAQSKPTAESWAQAFARFYGKMLDFYAEEFIVFFRAIADVRMPLLFHCSAGKDRTGVASALLLDCLGVSRELIFADYLRSSELLEGDEHFRNMLSDAKLDLYAELPEECRQVMLGTDPAYLRELFRCLDTQFGSVRSYLMRHGLTASEIERVLDALIEPSRSGFDAIVTGGQ